MKQINTQKSQNNSQKTSTASKVVFWTVSGGVAVFLSVAFFYWTLVPYMQSGEYLSNIRSSFASGDTSILVSDQFMFEPDSNVQGILRGDFLREVIGLYNGGQITKPTPLLDKAISEMEDYLSNHPDYYTYTLSLANAYSIKSDVTNDPAFFETAEKYYKRVSSVIKDRQDVIYTYAINLIKHKKYNEGLALLNDAVEKNPQIFNTHYQLGQAYIVIGESNYAIQGDPYLKSLSEFELALNHGANVNPGFTTQIYQELLRHFYKANDIEHFTTTINRLVEVDTEQKYAYLGVIDYMKTNHNIPTLNLESPKK